MFIRHRSEGIFAVPSSEAPFFEPQGSVLAGNMQRGSVFLSSLHHACAWHACNSPIEGGTGEPTSSLVKSNKTHRNDDWNRSDGSFVCFKSLREKVFPYMSQAMIESSFARIEKHRRVAVRHSAAALKLN